MWSVYVIRARAPRANLSSTCHRTYALQPLFGNQPCKHLRASTAVIARKRSVTAILCWLVRRTCLRFRRAFSCQGIGSLVLLLHGVTDIFVYLSKAGESSHRCYEGLCAHVCFMLYFELEGLSTAMRQDSMMPKDGHRQASFAM